MTTMPNNDNQKDTAAYMRMNKNMKGESDIHRKSMVTRKMVRGSVFWTFFVITKEGDDDNDIDKKD